MGRRSWVAAAVGCVLVPALPVVVSSTSTADAPRAARGFPGDDGLIAFVSDRDGNSEIYTMTPSGTSLTRLTTTTAGEYDPTWSPDGTQLLFSRNTGEDFEPQLFVADADGTDVRQVLDEDVYGLHPTWSPDGSQIAFTRIESGGQPTSVWVVDADGTDPRQLIDQPSGNPAWSPDGRSIAYEAYGVEGEQEVTQIYVADADGGDPRRLIDAEDIPDEQELAPDWSPDSTRIAFHATITDGTINDDLYVVEADGSGLRPLVEATYFDEREPAWSPDGESIAFTRSDDNPSLQRYYIWTVAADGSDQRDLASGGPTDTSASWQPAPEIDALTITPTNAAREVGDELTVEVAATDASGEPAADREVVLRVTGAHPSSVALVTDAAGRATTTYEGTTTGTDTLLACADADLSGTCQPAEPAASGSVLWTPRGAVDEPRLAFTDDTDALHAVDVARYFGEELSYATSGPPASYATGLSGYRAGPTHEGEAGGEGGTPPVFVSTRDDPAGEVYQARSTGDPVRVTCDPGTETHPVSAGSGVAYASDADGDWDVYLSLPPPPPPPARVAPFGRSAPPSVAATACNDTWTTVNLTDEVDGEPVRDELWPTYVPSTEELPYGSVVYSRAGAGELPDLWEVGFIAVPTDVQPGIARALTTTPDVAETQPAAMVRQVSLPCEDPCLPTNVSQGWVAFATTEFASAGTVAMLSPEDPATVVYPEQQRRLGTEPAWSSVVNPTHLAVTSIEDDPYGGIAVAEVDEPSLDGATPTPPLVGDFVTVQDGYSGLAASHPFWLDGFGVEDSTATLVVTGRADVGVRKDARVLAADVSDVRALDGSQRRVLRRARLLDDGEVVFRFDEAGPSYSPDGRHIVYSADRPDSDGSRTLVLADADGSDPVPLTGSDPSFGQTVDVDPVWSPDGGKVAFVRIRRPGGETSPDPPEIWVHDLSSGVQTRLPGQRGEDGDEDGADLSPSWAPDSRHLVVARSFGFGGGVLDAARRWQTFPFSSTAQLVVLDAEQPAAPAVTFDYCQDGCRVLGRSPAWSPDGRTIAFEDEAQLRTITLDGPCCTDPVLDIDPPTTIVGLQPADGADVPTSSRAVVATAQDPAWSPDGSEVAFTGQPVGHVDATGIWGIAPDGSDLRPITDEPGPESEPTYQDERYADVSVTVTVAGSPALVGAPVTATYVVRNAGPAPAADVSLVTAFTPGATTNAPAPPPGCRGNGTGCELGVLAPGASRVYVVRVRHATRVLGAATGTVTTTTNDLVLLNNTDTALYRVQGADVRVRVRLDEPIGYVGGVRTALVTVRNKGGDPVDDVAVTATWPTEVLPFVPPVLPAPAAPPAPACLPDGLACPLGTIGPGGVRRFRVGLEAVLEGAGVIRAEVTTSTAEVTTANNADEAGLEILQPTVRVLPGVAPPGKVVLAYGEAMPPGSEVTLAWATGITIHDGPYLVSDAGTVRVPMLVLRHDLMGTRSVTAASETDLFSPVDGDLLVVPRTLAPPNFNGRG